MRLRRRHFRRRSAQSIHKPFSTFYPISTPDRRREPPEFMDKGKTMLLSWCTYCSPSFLFPLFLRLSNRPFPFSPPSNFQAPEGKPPTRDGRRQPTMRPRPPVAAPGYTTAGHTRGRSRLWKQFSKNKRGGEGECGKRRGEEEDFIFLSLLLLLPSSHRERERERERERDGVGGERASLASSHGSVDDGLFGFHGISGATGEP